jgi:hypothetical protein
MKALNQSADIPVSSWAGTSTRTTRRWLHQRTGQARYKRSVLRVRPDWVANPDPPSPGSSHGQASPHEELSVRGVIAAVRIPIFKKREWRDRNVEVALATGVLSEFQGQILIALLKDRIAGSATKCHADL